MAMIKLDDDLYQTLKADARTLFENHGYVSPTRLIHHILDSHYEAKASRTNDLGVGTPAPVQLEADLVWPNEDNT